MSLPPITIPLLDPAGPIDPDNDLLLIRQGLNDRKIPAGSLQQVRLTGLQMLPSQLVASDVLLIGRDNGSGYDNYIMPPQYLGFLNGTNCWFYQASAPLGWTVIPNVGDRLLAISDISTQVSPPPAKYNAVFAPNLTGDWLQKNAVLNITQIPAHSHVIKVWKSDQEGNLSPKIGSTNRTTGNNQNTGNTGGIGSTNTASSEPAGATQGHNHGNEWRPLAAVGILCTKNKQIGQ
jgi:hypothetical protein